MKRKLLITGGGGYLGSNLARHFMSSYEVHVTARDGADALRLERIRGKITIHRCDLSQEKETTSLIETVRPEVIIHTAAYGIAPKLNDTGILWSTNFEGTRYLLRVCETAGFDCFINIGSYLEYGENEQVLTERTATEPDTEYGKSKAAATRYCEDRAKETGKPILTLRLFTLFGKDENPHRLFPSIINAYRKGKAPTLSSPEHCRDFVFIDDAIDAVERAITHPVAGVYNICSGEEHRIGDVVDEIRSHIPGTKDPTYGGDGRTYDYSRCVGDSSKFRVLTGWRPTPFKEAVGKTVEWYLQQS